MTATQGEAQALQAILGFRLVTPDLSRLLDFYHAVLGFALEGAAQPISQMELACLGVTGGAVRQVLSIGMQRIAIEQFERAGQPYPSRSDAASLWFQHLALVVVDIAEACGRLRDAIPISRHGPQQLPPASGSVKAFKFRDPDGHPLELLEFPVGKSPAAWAGRAPVTGQIALGIDHTAISVRDVTVSTRFYTGLGLALAPRTLNQGPAQQDLDGLQDAQVAVAPLRPQAGTPHLELLGYEVPRGETGPVLRPNDVAATRIAWRGAVPGLLADPDGHLHQVVS
jgi:catechol 2,3-dioxygenase-like lactoylglutathione lyase family enzyme